MVKLAAAALGFCLILPAIAHADDELDCSFSSATDDFFFGGLSAKLGSSKLENISGSFETASFRLPASLSSFEFRLDQLVEQSFDANAIHLKFDVKTGTTQAAPSMIITIDGRHASNDNIAYVGKYSLVVSPPRQEFTGTVYCYVQN
jgi:hypothetical protein